MYITFRAEYMENISLKSRNREQGNTLSNDTTVYFFWRGGDKLEMKKTRNVIFTRSYSKTFQDRRKIVAARLNAQISKSGKKI